MDDVRIAAYLDNQLRGTERERFESHIAQCADCRQAVVDAEQLLKTVRPRRGRKSIVLLAGLVVALAGTRMISLRRDHADRVRASSDLMAIPVYAPVGNVGHTVLRFAWAPLPRALSYKLEVTDAAGHSIWTASPADTTLTLPPAVVLHRGTSYFWSVDAIATDGSVRSTGAHEFRLTN
ncbi:MAG: zf-HC2 domain-containing protein [Gemmatimonadaceae bacterium]